MADVFDEKLQNMRSGYGGYISGSTLKWIAALAMLSDHFSRFLFAPAGWCTSIVPFMKYFGRLAFPIYAFLLVEGFAHTSDAKKYSLRLFAFALLSELPYDLAFYHRWIYAGDQNVFFTLLLGLLMLMALERLQTHPAALSLQLQAICGILVIAAAAGLAWLLQADYSYAGIAVIALLYILRSDRFRAIFGGSLALVVIYGSVEAPALISILPVMLYNGRKGKGPKMLFYLIYPVHLLLLAALAHLFL